jgi:type VI protein secretion system component VasK
MNFWEVMLIIVVGGMIYSAWRSKHLAKLGAYEDEKGKIHQLGTAREAELEREVTELRERVKVLERIATDGRDTRLLSDEIEKLRDQ